MLQSRPGWRPLGAAEPPPKSRFDIESLLAKPEPARRRPAPLPPAAWPAPRLPCALGLLPCPAAAAAAAFYLAEPPAAFLPPPPPPPPPRPCAQPACKRAAAVPGLELSQCTSVRSLGAPLSWRPGGPCKMKRVRTVFTQEQLERLEQEFLKQQYMVGTERVDLAATLHLSETQVKVWFQNRRIKWRKQSLEQKAAKLSQFGVTQPTSPEQPEGRDSKEDPLEVEA